jgi:hypothetical protein
MLSLCQNSKNALSFLLSLSYVFSSTNLEKAEQILPGSELRGERGGREQGGEMAQTMYVHMNK